MKIKLAFKLLYSKFVSFFAEAIIEGFYGGFFQYKSNAKKVSSLYISYLKNYNSFIGFNAKFKSPPITPHGLNRIHISENAVIGSNCIIFQQVTIGSNTLKGSPHYGSPNIGDNVLIGAGAKIIGNVFIGNNCRIGANCVVVKDMPPNTVAVLSPTRFIMKEEMMENNFSGILEKHV